MRIQARSLLRAGRLGKEGLVQKLKTHALRSSVTKTCTPTRAIPELLTCEDRQIFHAHLLRLDKQTCQDRFGGDCLNEDFFERYVLNINFTNTRLIGVFVADTLGITMNTTKTHLKHIFAKTGVTRQGELMRLIMLSSRPIRNTTEK